MFEVIGFLSSGLLLAEEVSNEAAESNGVFSGTMADSIWTIVWFVVLLLVLKKFAWRHILDGLQAREDHISKEISDAENARKTAEQVLDEYKAKLDNADTEAKTLAKVHINKAESRAREIVDLAEQAGKAVKTKAEAEIVQAKVQARNELFNEAGDIVLGLGSEILGRTITEQDNQRLIDNALEKYRNLNNPSG